MTSKHETFSKCWPLYCLAQLRFAEWKKNWKSLFSIHQLMSLLCWMRVEVKTTHLLSNAATPSPCQPPPWPRCTMGLFSHRNYGINSRPPHQPLQQLVIHPPPPFTPPAILPSPATPATTPCNHLSTADMCLLFTQATFNVKWHSIWIKRGIRLAKIGDNWRELTCFCDIYVHLAVKWKTCSHPSLEVLN